MDSWEYPIFLSVYWYWFLFFVFFRVSVNSTFETERDFKKKLVSFSWFTISINIQSKFVTVLLHAFSIHGDLMFNV